MTIAVATDSDIIDLTNVEINSKEESLAGITEDHEVDYPLRVSRWVAYFQGLSPQTSKPERLVLKAVVQNKLVGYIAGHLTSRYGMDAEIQSFYILRPYQRQGLGKNLLRSFAQWLVTKKAKSLCVGISPANKYKAFYFKNGGQYLNEHWIYWTDLQKQLTTTSS